MGAARGARASKARETRTGSAAGRDPNAWREDGGKGRVRGNHRPLRPRGGELRRIDAAGLILGCRRGWRPDRRTTRRRHHWRGCPCRMRIRSGPFGSRRASARWTVRRRHRHWRGCPYPSHPPHWPGRRWARAWAWAWARASARASAIQRYGHLVSHFSRFFDRAESSERLIKNLFFHAALSPKESTYSREAGWPTPRGARLP